MALDLGIFLQGSSNSNKVKVTDNDALAQYLKDKITSVDASVTITERNDGGVETLDLAVGGSSDTNIANTNLTNDANRVVDLNGFKTGFTGGELGFGVALPDDSAQVEVSATDKGLLIPRVTTAQMNLITAPATNLLVFNTDLSALYRYDGSNWVALSAGYGIVSVNDASGIPTFYATLKDAVDAGGAGSVINLHSNITIDDATEQVNAGFDLTINGNGYTITHTCNSGDDFSVIRGGGSANNLYLNNIKIISNGTASGFYTASVFGGITNSYGDIWLSNDSYIYALNNDIAEFSHLHGGKLEAENGRVSFAGSISDATVITKYSRNDFYRCNITVVSGGELGQDTSAIIDCYIEGDATVDHMIHIKRNTKFWNNTVVCTSGTNYVIDINSGASGDFVNIKNCHIYNYGTGGGIFAQYNSHIKDTYVYTEGGIGLYFLNNNKTVDRYDLENVHVVTNDLSQPAIRRQNGIDTTYFKNVIAECLNPLNDDPAILTETNVVIYLEDCTAIVNNNSVPNIKITGVGTYYAFGVKMSGTGTGIDGGTATLGNTTGTLDEYGNGQLE